MTTSVEDTAWKVQLLRAGWLLAALGPPSVVGATWRPLWAKHAIIALLLLIAYWIFLFIGGIAGGLADRWRNRLIDRFDDASMRLLSRFDKKYATYVLSSLRFIDQKGLPTIGIYTPELDEVFVDVSLARLPPHAVSADPLADLPAHVTERLSLSNLLDRETPAVLAVTGAPGSGKTTLLRHTARSVCQFQHRRRGHIPVLLYLRDHASAIVNVSDAGIPSLLDSTLGRHGPAPHGWLERELNNGNCVVLLDGLDEIAREEDRRTVSAWVERQIAQYPKNDYVITSRPYGYRTAPIEGATVLQTRRFTDGQATRFVRGWYLAMERRSTGTDGEDVLMLATAGADDLLERLNRAPALYELTVNPLLLTMVATVHRFRGALPGSRAELYRDICEVMLWRRHEAKNLSSELTGEHKEAVLRELSFKMMQHKVRDLTTIQILDAIRPALSRISRTLTAREFLNDVGSSGLMIEREPGTYTFTHHTFQEYLASTHIKERGMVEVLAGVVDDTWWRETTLLYAARSDVDPIINACIKSGTVTALNLAFDCAEQGTALAPELRQHLEDLITQARNPKADVELRILASRILISRQLRRVIPVSSGGRICLQAITKATYALFLDHANHQGYTRAPDGPPVSTDSPVLGVRGEDAVAFTAWINNLLGDPVYRLPTLEEVTDPAAQQALMLSKHHLWTCSEGGSPERWNGNGFDQPYLIEPSNISSHVTADIASSGSTPLRLLLIRCVTAASLILHASRTHIVEYGTAREITSRLTHDLMRDIDLARKLDLNRNLLGLRRAYSLIQRPTEDSLFEFIRTLARDLDLRREFEPDNHWARYAY